MEHCPELNDFVATPSDCILHVQCDSDTRAISQGIFDFLNTSAEKGRLVLYFPFNSRDIRFSNISAMLATFITQLAYVSSGARTESTAMTLNRFLAHQIWSALDLNLCWEYLREAVSANDGIFYVLGEFDQCDESGRWFLEQIKYHMRSTENRFKIVIVSSTRANSNKALAVSEFPVDAYREIVVGSRNLLEPMAPVGSSYEVAMLLEERPEYVACESKIQALMRACAGDSSLCELVAQWLRSRQQAVGADADTGADADANADTDAIEAELDNMTPFTPATVCVAILRSVPRERQSWARKLISWVLLAVRPLRVEEFGVVSQLAVALVRRQEKSSSGLPSTLPRRASDASQIQSRLPGIFRVVHDEVHLSHACLQQLLESGPHQAGPAREWYQAENEGHRHLDILETCLAFLTRPTTRSVTGVLPTPDPVTAPTTTSLPKPEPQPPQLPYAVQHWARHYARHQADGEESAHVIQDGLSKLLRDQATRQSWQERYDQLANPCLRPSEPFQTPLSVAAHFGLDELVEVFRSEFRHESSLALVEAARHGHLATVRHMLRPDRPSLASDVYDLGQALMAAMATATGAGDDAIILAILEWICHEKAHFLSPGWHNILCRAASLGLDTVVQAILGLGTDAEPLNVEHGETPLALAAVRRHQATAKLLLDAGARLTVKSPLGGLTPLHHAATSGSADVVRLLLQYGSEAGVKDERDRTPLQLACRWGQHAAVEVLLDHQRFQEYHDPGEASDEGQPLLIAVRRGVIKTVDSLLRHGADPNIHDDEGTSLFSAVSQRRIDICRLLLANKADVNSVKGGFNPALIKAVRVGDLDIVNLLLDHHADTETTEEGDARAGEQGWRRTALHVAVCNDQREIAKVLLERGANPNVRDVDDWTSLWAAACFGHAEIARLLIDHDADVHAVCTTREWTPLHVAYESAELVRILLQHGADVNKSSPAGTPFDLAAWHNQPEVVKLMLGSKNPRVDLTTEASRAVLMDAVAAGSRDVVGHMLEAGADVNLTNDAGRPLIGIAIICKDEDTVRTILEFRPDMDVQDTNGDTCLHYIGPTTSLVAVRLAVNAGAKVNGVNKIGENPLHQAAAFSSLEVTEYLLSKKADVNCSGGPWGPPLHNPCHEANLGMVKLLIDSGANTNFPSRGMYGTPITAACIGSRKNADNETVRILRLLLESGADIHLPGGLLGYSILAASMASSAAVARWLLDQGASPDVEDRMGRKSVHHASSNSIATLNAIGPAQDSFAVKDKCGRVALHYAAMTGQLDLVKHVWTRSETVGVGIDEPDNDDWTPLLWAARAVLLWAWADRFCYHFDVVNFLLENGANPESRGRGTDRNWLPQEVAIYHGAAPTVVAAIESRLASPRKFYGQYQKGSKTEKCCDFCLMVNSHPDFVGRLH